MKEEIRNALSNNVSSPVPAGVGTFLGYTWSDLAAIATIILVIVQLLFTFKDRWDKAKREKDGEAAA